MRFGTRTIILLCAAFSAAIPTTLNAQPHLIQAEQLLSALLADPSNVNKYGTTSVNNQNGTSAHIDWSGDPRTAISECSTFLTLLMEHSYGYSEATYKLMTGHASPTASIYHDNILAGLSFTQVASPSMLLPGDIIAVKYPAGSSVTGHVMTTVSLGAWQARANSTQSFLAPSNYPEIAGFFDVTIIDSTSSYHGPSDARASKPGGIGQGVVRIYVDASLNFTGYTWSTENGSAYESVGTTGRLTAFGRWNPQALPLTPQTISFAALSNQALGAPPLTLLATATSGLPVSYSSQTDTICSVSGSKVTLLAAGTCTVQATQAGNATYAAATPVNQSFQVAAAQAAQTITFAPLQNLIYGAPPFPVAASASSGLPVSFSSQTSTVCSVSGSTVTPRTIGVCTIQATQAGNGAFLPAAPVNQSFAISYSVGQPGSQLHLTQAEQLLAALLSDPTDVNQFGETSVNNQNGTSGHIDWTGDPRTAITNGSTFLTLLMEQTYGYSQAAFLAKVGSASPTAALYHDDIVTGTAFTQVAGPTALQPGDTIAVKYPAGQESTGAVMTVVSVGAWQPSSNSTQTFLTGGTHPEIAGFYDVNIIDSCDSYHGSTDTRVNKPGGIGQGVMRIYVDGSLNLTGYTWSTVNASEYEAPAAGYLMAFGRWIP